MNIKGNDGPIQTLNTECITFSAQIWTKVLCMERFQIRPNNILFSILFLQIKSKYPDFYCEDRKPFSHVNVKSLILFRHMRSTNIGVQPMRIRISRSSSSVVQQTEPTTGLENRDRNTLSPGIILRLPANKSSGWIRSIIRVRQYVIFQS